MNLPIEAIFAIGLLAGMGFILTQIMQQQRARKRTAARQLENKKNGMTSEEKGRAFEEYIITRFDRNEYKLLEWRGDKYCKGWGGAEANCKPDLTFENKRSGDRFAVECKFRSRPNGRKLEWATDEQLQRYRDYQGKEKIPVFIAIGLGGNPRDPEALFIMRLDRMKFPDVMMHYLDKFRFPAHPAGLEFG